MTATRPVQTRRGSLFEALASTAVGLLVGFVTNIVVLREGYGLEVSLTAAAEMTAIFTAVSIARGYLVRRLFEVWGRR